LAANDEAAAAAGTPRGLAFGKTRPPPSGAASLGLARKPHPLGAVGVLLGVRPQSKVLGRLRWDAGRPEITRQRRPELGRRRLWGEIAVASRQPGQPVRYLLAIRIQQLGTGLAAVQRWWVERDHGGGEDEDSRTGRDADHHPAIELGNPAPRAKSQTLGFDLLWPSRW
jgi:hypothetical protein